MSRDLTELQAFKAMTLFLWRYSQRVGNDVDFLDLITDLELDQFDNTMDPAAWDDWLDCVAHIADGGDTPVRVGTFSP